MAASKMDEHDLLIIVDATVSMSSYLTSLRSSIPQIITISAMTGCFTRIGLLAYRDYDSSPVTQWSGWFHPEHELRGDQPDLLEAAKKLEPIGGWDTPEAVKSGLAVAYDLMRPDAKTLIFLFADAPPHPRQIHNEHKCTKNGSKEEKALRATHATRIADQGSSFVDWVEACGMLTTGPKKAQVFPILSYNHSGWAGVTYSYFIYLATVMGGATIISQTHKPELISNITVNVLLAWMGVEKANVSETDLKTATETHSQLWHYHSLTQLDEVTCEWAKASRNFLACLCSDNKMDLRLNTQSENLYAQDMMRKLPKKEVPCQNFAERWKTDERYKDLVIRHLLKVIEEDIQLITVNPVFGSLWRTLCNDKEHPRRTEVIDAFSTALNKIQSPRVKEAIEHWLEESYDFTADVLQIINSVPKEEQYPCVFLDPTLTFSSTGTNGQENIEDETASLARKDLLEIGRSCNAGILRRIGRALTHLTSARSETDIPEHISKAGLEMVPRIPLALAKQEYGREFWKILLHLIVPGTFLSARPAALVAALSIRLGMKFLNDAAVHEMLLFKNRWNDVETTENWTVGCLSLLIDADAVSQKQQKMENSNNDIKPLLIPSDHQLFEKLISLKVLENNIGRVLEAKISWSPSKAIAAIGPQVVCKSCSHPRSVTMMAEGSICGLCYGTPFPPDDLERRLTVNVAKDCSPTSPGAWAECCNRVCRAQYIVYGTDDLRVRPKCHYCRSQSGGSSKTTAVAPTVECIQCESRMIWPEEYRPADFRDSDFVCPPCTSGKATIVDVEVQVKTLAEENGYSWLVLSDEYPSQDLFQGRSLFHTITQVGTGKFMSGINLLPDTWVTLRLKGKRIRNSAALVSSLRERVAKRKTDRAECSLCFSPSRREHLNPACGRRGCFQRVCTDCLEGWYGLNSAGKIINTAPLTCPFCRRPPVQRTLIKYGKGIHAVRDLASAVANRGTLIYAWCMTCSSAKQLMERHCADGAPPEVNGWVCGDCQDTRDREQIERQRMRAAHDLAMAVTPEEIEAAERRREAAEKAAEELGVDGVKPCPGCGALSQRISGCGHMTCPMDGCNRDWCWFCGEEVPGDDIYWHMDDVHGGYFGGAFESDDPGDEMDWDD